LHFIPLWGTSDTVAILNSTLIGLEIDSIPINENEEEKE
jgi:hypothetical protein